jgi:histidine triad (HIT) family protein
MDCLFCNIISGERRSKKVYEDELVYAFEDINPQAPVHILIVPKKHISTLLDIKEEDKSLMGHLYMIANRIARERGVADRGFRTLINCNPESGQTVYHIHLHLLGGRIMHWPPG